VTIDAFYRLVTALSNVNFGDFDAIGKYFGNSTEDAERLDGLNLTFLVLQVRKLCDSRCRTELEVFLIRRSHMENSAWVQDIILVVKLCTNLLVGGKVSILGGDSFGYCEKKKCI
jgi:hypothetical protein